MRPESAPPSSQGATRGVPDGSDLERADGILLRRVDAQMDHAYDLGGDHLACRPGCTECCIGPFAINALEAWRLRRGVEALWRRDPKRAAALVDRALEAQKLLRPGFPGNAERGVLAEEELDEADLEVFFDLHGDLPCPVLDPASGRCELYAYRPVTCRSYGPPVRIGGDALDPCSLCFQSVPRDELEPFRVDLDPEGLEDTLLDALARGGGETHRTLIAFAVGAEAEDKMEGRAQAAAAKPILGC